MNHIEDQMTETLNKPGDAREKLDHYNDLLQNYMTHNDKYEKTPVLPPISTVKNVPNEDSTIEPTDPWEQEIISSVPVTYREKARLIMRRIKNSSGKLGWNNSGEMIRNGVAIPGTNIVDLMGDVVRKRKTVAAPPGMVHFTSGLQEINVPREAVGNIDRFLTPSLVEGVQPNKRRRKRVISTPRGWLSYRRT